MSRWLYLLMVGVVDVRVGSRARMARIIRRADPFQRIGIPCWKAYAGPLSDAGES